MKIEPSHNPQLFQPELLQKATVNILYTYPTAYVK